MYRILGNIPSQKSFSGSSQPLALGYTMFKGVGVPGGILGLGNGLLKNGLFRIMSIKTLSYKASTC